MTPWRSTLRVLTDALFLALSCGLLPLWIAGRTLAILTGSPLPPLPPA